MKNNLTSMNPFFDKKSDLALLQRAHSFEFLKGLLVLFFVLFSSLGFGQVSNYTFSQAIGTYTSIGTSSIVHSGSWDDGVSSVAIPFTFYFNGIGYTSCSVNTNGYLTFGSTTSATNGYTPISSATSYAGCVSALGVNLINNLSSPISYSSTGSTPNRVFVVQWNNARRRTSGITRDADFNFQIRLYETTNVIQIIYGTSATTYTTDIPVQVGLRGALASDFNNRSLSSNWNASTAGTLNTHTCNTGTGTNELPVSGQTYTWTPPVCTSTVTAPTTIAPSTNPICVGGSTTLTASGGSLSGFSTLWFEGSCGAVGYGQEWQTQPYATTDTAPISVGSGSLNVTSTTNDPWIFMYNIGSFNPVTYKNIAVRYRVMSGTPDGMQIYFTNATHTEANAAQLVGVLLPVDNLWHIANLDMSAHAAWDDSNITGWRFDYATASGAQLEIDYIVLTDKPVLEPTQGNEATIIVAPTVTTSYYARRMAESSCFYSPASCASSTITVNPVNTIASVTGARRCGTGTVILHALGAAGTTHFRWYTASSGGSPVATTPIATPYWTTPSISSTTIYYVSAFNGNCESPRVAVTATIDPVPTISAPTTISGTKIVCPGGSTTLAASGGSTGSGASTLWFSDGCADIAFGQEWRSQPYGSGGTSGGASGGILNVTSTNVDPQINMFNVGVFNPNIYRYMIIRYQVVSGAAGSAEIYFENVTNSGLSESKVARGNLISDAQWHVLSIDMATSAAWDDFDITGWRFDWASQTGVTMNIDYIALSSRAALENTNPVDNAISVAPVGDVMYYALYMEELDCFAVTTCASTIVYGGKTWTGAVNNNWATAGNWSPSGVPTSNHCVQASSGAITVGSNSNANSITLSGTSGLTVSSNVTLTVENAINTSGSSGTFTVQDSGSLLQNSEATNTGNIIVLRNAKPMKRYDYTYWSSPVTPQTLYNLSNNTLSDKYYSWNPLSGWTIHYNGAVVMDIAKGYIVRAPQSFPIAATGNFTGTFIGVPNNGEKTVAGFQGSASTQMWNLIGNPYPSSIDIDLFLADPDNTEVGGTIYLWTHNTPPVGNGSGQYIYTSNDYAAYNLSGGVGTGPAVLDPNDPNASDNNYNNLTNGYVASGQAFFIRGITNGAGTVKFKNSMRGAGNNTNFFKPGPTTPVENWEMTGKHRFWINLTNTEGAFNQALIGYVENATNELDRLYDGEVFGGNFVTIYSLLDLNKLTIQGRALPFNNQDVVPLGYKTTIAGTFDISLDHFDGLFEGQDVFLKDKLLNVIHNLKESAYSFTSIIGTFDNRFEVVYQNEILEIENSEVNPESVIIYKNDNSDIVVNGGLLTLDEVKVYDVAGRLIFQTRNINSTETFIKNLPDTQQVLIVDVLTKGGYKTVKKIVF